MGEALWQQIYRAHHLEHVFSWLALSEAQLQHTPGVSMNRAKLLWHQFTLARQRPFNDWLLAMGVPLNRKALSALDRRHWQQLAEMSESDWRAHSWVGAVKASQMIRWLAEPDVASLAQWLAAQDIVGFKPQ